MRPWEMRAGEPSRWFYRFDGFFRPIGPERSIEAAYQKWKAEEKGGQGAGQAPRVWYENATLWEWYDRAAAWDREQRTLALREERAAIRQMNQRHVKLALLAQDLGTQRYATLQRRIASAKRMMQEGMSETEADRLIEELVGLEDARMLLRQGVDLERLARGAATEIVEHYTPEIEDRWTGAGNDAEWVDRLAQTLAEHGRERGVGDRSDLAEGAAAG